MDNQFISTNSGEAGSAGGNDVNVSNPAVPSNVPQNPPVSGAPPGQTPAAVENSPPVNYPSPNPFAPRTPTHTYEQQPKPRFSPTVKMVGGFILVILIVVGAIAAFVVSRSQQNEVASQTAADFDNQEIALAEIDQTGAISVDGKALSINGQLRANGSLVMAPAARPTIPTTGQIYYDQTSNHLSYYNGTEYVQLQTNQDASGTTVNNTGGTTINNITNLSVVNTTVISADSPAGGTTGKIAKFTSGQTLGDSILTDSNTYLSVDGGINLTAQTSTSDLSLWPDLPTPSNFDTTEIGNLEIGVKFQVDVPGTIKAIRFYKATIEDTVTIPVSLWTTAGALVGQTTITVSGTGWKTATFASPLAVSPDTTYIASYHVNSATPSQAIGYPYTSQYFSSSGVDNGPLHGLASGLDGGNGVYRNIATPAMPNRTYNSTNYWIDVVFTGSQFTTDSRIRINNSQISSSDLSNDNNIAKRGSSQVFSGTNIFRNAGDGSEVFSIQKADTTQLFTVDSANSRVHIGPIGATGDVLLVLGNRTGNGDPINAADGAMYYHATDGVFRCWSNNGWSNCGEINPTRTFSQYDEFMGGQTTSLGSNNIIGSLGWNAFAIGANGSINFNPATPTPSADRPGVLALTTPAVANQGTTLSLANGNGGSTIIRRGNTVRTAVAVGAATGQVLRVGLHSQTTGSAQPVSGVWWEADPAASPNWRYCYGNGTTATCAATTPAVPIAANTWVRLTISVDATGAGTSNATFTINGQTPSSTVSNVTIDTTNRVSPALSCYGTDGAAKDCYWDYYQFTGNTSAAR